MRRYGVGQQPKNFQDLAIVRILDSLTDIEVTIGIHNEEGSQIEPGSNATMAQIAAYNEYGTTQIPARPAYRQFIAGDLANQAADQLVDDLKQATTADGSEMALARFGERMAEGLWQSVDNFISPPNAAATVRAKGFNSPLKHTGRTRDSISWVLKRRGARLKKEFARR